MSDYYAPDHDGWRTQIAAHKREEAQQKQHKANGSPTVIDFPSATPAVAERKAFPWVDMYKWDSEPAPEREWAIKDRVPLRQAGLFSGEGGVGKSLVELAKNVAHVTGKDWLGSMPEVGPAFYLGAEDEGDEIRRR